MDKTTKPFGTFDVVKSKIEIKLKTTSIINKKEKLVRKIKNKFGEGVEVAEEEEDEEDDEDEEEQGQGPIELTQGLGQDKEEGVEEEEAKEAPVQAKPKK